MGSFFLTLLFVVVIPLAEGGLLALLLREEYIRYPQPLGGTIGQRKVRTKPSQSAEPDSAEPDDVPESIKSTISAPDAATDNGNIPEIPSAEGTLPTDIPTDGTPQVDSDEEQNVPTRSGISVFDGTENIPDNLSVGSLIESMTTDESVVISSDLENRIEASALPIGDIPDALQPTSDDPLNSDHLQALAEALAEALPISKADFSQEFETNPEQTDSMSPMARDVLGENFDIDALEQQSLQAKKSFKFFAPADNAVAEDSESSATGAEATEIALDVQDDGSGMVQVSTNPFFADTLPQLIGFGVPETIESSFSGDWIQEANITADESMLGEPLQFCFTEELRPAFVKRKKASQ